MTIQEKMQAKLEQVGLPYKKINCYGRQIVVTSLCEDTARKWVTVLGKFSKVKGLFDLLCASLCFLVSLCAG